MFVNVRKEDNRVCDKCHRVLEGRSVVLPSMTGSMTFLCETCGKEEQDKVDQAYKSMLGGTFK